MEHLHDPTSKTAVQRKYRWQRSFPFALKVMNEERLNLQS